ncbi:MAG: hypothetical protein HY482_01545 [Candidatus Wildermuthbacteria bacterium]|nr:hypothetical protein [Candidatus Wildermuthbacteria bacterium]
MEFSLLVLAIDREIFAGQAIALCVPAETGVLEVLAGHTPLVAKLKEGDIVITTKTGEKTKFPIAGGVLEVKPEGVAALVKF